MSKLVVLVIPAGLYAVNDDFNRWHWFDSLADVCQKARAIWDSPTVEHDIIVKKYSGSILDRTAMLEAIDSAQYWGDSKATNGGSEPAIIARHPQSAATAFKAKPVDSIIPYNPKHTTWEKPT